MKKAIHPDYKELRVKIGSDIFHTMSACTQNEILMDIDFRKHPAWTKKGVTTANDSNQNVSNFNNKYAGLSFGVKK